MFNLEWIGLDDPEIWRIIRWIDSKIKIVNGKIKWNEKNRFNVALLIENPPQIHSTIIFPI